MLRELYVAMVLHREQRLMPSSRSRPLIVPPLRVVPPPISPPPTPRRAPLAATNIVPLRPDFGHRTSDFGQKLPDITELSVPAPAQSEVRSPTSDVPSSRWAAFEKLGLVAPKLDPRKLSRHVVTGYRLLGFAILTIIVIVLVGYIAQTTFFYLSTSWIVPMAVSPTDDKVIALQSQLTERQNVRDRIAADLADAERGIAVQHGFQAEFAKAIRSDLADRKAAFARMHELASAASSTRVAIRRSNTAYAASSQRRMGQEYAAGLIDRQAMLSGKFQLAQIASSNLSLAERQADYESKAADLEAQTRSLEALLANAKSDAPMSYDVLKIKEEYDRSALEAQKAIGLRDALQASLAREDLMVAQLQHTSYLRALADHAQVAFVPYGNLGGIEHGTGLYGCRLGMIACHRVGSVLEVLPGEVQFKHPNRDKMLRGQMVELSLDDGAAATDDVLFVGGRPLLF